ncbi:MAG: PHP domain-containing protein [Defluviitaleaceae bacterium]|nr:PHP domain-containing protein [Defluviitaleaceae bacterium]
MLLYETHMHTSTVSACAISTPEVQVRAYKKKGYTGIIITDHFVNGYTHTITHLPWIEKMQFFVSGYEKAALEGKKCGLDVFFGIEYSINGLDFLIYGLTLEFLIAHSNIAGLTIENISALVRDNNGYIAQAHPYRAGYWIDNPRPVNAKLLDGIEVYNVTDPDHNNQKAFQFAQQHNLSMQAGSDCHDAKQKRLSGIELTKKAENIHDIIHALKSKEAKILVPGGLFDNDIS